MALLLVVLASCSSGEGSDGKSTEAAVSTDKVDLPRSYKFEPVAIKVEPGTTVTWTNNDQFTHSVRMTDGADFEEVMKPGEEATFEFTEPGLYSYDCSFHAQQMDGTVLVE